MDIGSRKDDHIDICLEKNVQVGYNHWDDVNIVHEALPSCDLDDIDLSTKLLGKELKAPLVISSMTGGSRRAKSINEILAKAASEYGLAMGVGSQRAAVEENKHRDSYAVVKEYEIPLVLGNIGAPQFTGKNEHDLYEKMIDDALEMIGGDGVFIHLNYLQEVVQPEGETGVGVFLDNLSYLSSKYNILVKETGAGISRKAALKLKEAGVKAIDIAGASGTSFAAVESYRGRDGNTPSRIGSTFWNWGLPSPVSLLLSNVGVPLISSGGIRNGLDIARSLAMGARSAGMAWHLLVKASKGYGPLCTEIESILEEIRAGIFLGGAVSAKNSGSMGYYINGRTGRIMDELTR